LNLLGNHAGCFRPGAARFISISVCVEFVIDTDRPKQQNPIMKILPSLFLAGVLLAFLAGCSTTQQTQQTEDLLVSCGFKTVAAATPAQQAHLKTLPPGKISTVKRNGKTLYVFPDAAHSRIYVGNPSQYQSFQQAYQDAQLINGRIEAVHEREDAAVWDCWASGEFYAD
jgi:hypothetical protein